jgi:GNAT superfamily N-acetyltransferase
MAITIRNLIRDDLPEITRVSSSNWDDDYVPRDFTGWLGDSNWHPIGVFDNGRLVSFAALQEVPGTAYGWVRALRTDRDHHRQGYGLKAVERTIEIAKAHEVSELRYATSSRNEASLALARKLGFSLIDEVGYFRLEKPYPPRPKASPSFIPLKVDAERAFDTLQRFPDIVSTITLPLAWEFEDKNLESLKRVEQDGDFYLIVDESGESLTLYYKSLHERRGAKVATFSIFSRDRSTFVDTISRLVDECEHEDIEQIVFFLGPNATEWSSTLMLVPEEFQERRFVLLVLKL